MTATASCPALHHVTHQQMANAIRALSMDAVEKAKSGHPGMPMGMADVATVLFTQFMQVDVHHPRWPDRDRFILSAGHGSMLHYALNYLLGYPDMTLEELKNFRQWGAKTAGHPEYGHAEGIETTTGPLGQGIANAVGMALAERMLNARFGDALVKHFTYVIAGDGCLMEGISQEAITLAGHWKLSQMIVLWDDNGICIDGAVSLASSEDQLKRFEAAGWDVQAIDGHDPEAIAAAIAKAQTTATPSLIACKTTIAYGAPTKAGSEKSHGSPLGAEEIAGTRSALGWDYAPFEIPDAVVKAWRQAAERGCNAYKAWQARLNAAPAEVRDAFEAHMSGDLPGDWQAALRTFKQQMVTEQPKLATRQASGKVLEVLTEQLPELIGGSADLTGSVNTRTPALGKAVTAEDFSGRFIHWGIREHGMAAAMNGMALHGGFVPYSGTFMVFTDYCKPAIRLSALMQQRVIYVMTHDSIGLGEDGPTHQPIEHLAALRAVPNLLLFRPADVVETAEAWELALAHKEMPSVLSLTRQALPHLRKDASVNQTARGGYILSPAKSKAQAVLMATGSEVHLAMQAQETLWQQGVDVQVVSLPCTQLFDAQPKAYRDEVIPPALPAVAMEAAIGFGWERYIGRDGVFIGMKGFGASAPAEELYQQFGITADAAVKAVQGLLK